MGKFVPGGVAVHPVRAGLPGSMPDKLVATW
jgi:hypothetical protein